MTEQPFDRALRQAALYVTQHYPGEQVRIGRGLEIALNDGVQFGMTIPDPDAWVRGSQETLYEIRGTHCDCPDEKAPGLRCKHRWAVALTRIAQALHDLADAQA